MKLNIFCSACAGVHPSSTFHRDLDSLILEAFYLNLTHFLLQSIHYLHAVCVLFLCRKGGRLREPVIVQQIERRTNWMKLLLVLLKDPPMFWFALFSTFQTWFHRSSLSHAVQQSCSRRAARDPRERHKHWCGERESLLLMYSGK